jgi:hypothetical protein
MPKSQRMMMINNWQHFDKLPNMEYYNTRQGMEGAAWILLQQKKLQETGIWHIAAWRYYVPRAG